MQNKFNYPDYVERSVLGSNTYPENPDWDYSPTTLNRTPQQIVLGRQHSEIEEEDLDDKWARFFGTVSHEAFAKYQRPTDIVEKRFYKTLEGYVISGQIDLYQPDKKKLIDLKTGSIWSVISALENGKEDWNLQLNTLAWLLPYEVETMEIFQINKDWRIGEAVNKEKKGEFYPNKGTVVRVPFYKEGEIEKIMLTKIKDVEAEVTRPCTPEERWYRGEKFAVTKKGNKKATNLYDFKDDADKRVEQLGSAYSVIRRPGVFGKCLNYCSVRSVCPQFLGEQT
jgi:hypothetical protein